MLNSDPTLMPHVVGLLRKHGPMSYAVHLERAAAKTPQQATLFVAPGPGATLSGNRLI